MIKLNGKQITPTMFPDNTSQVWKIEIPTSYWDLSRIEWDFSHEGEFLQVAQLKDLLDSKGVDSELFLSYLPYGRQDKVIDNDKTFALHTFSRLINSLGFKAVWCLDPHSSTANLLINNFCPYYPNNTSKVQAILNPDAICYPDKGAHEKYTKLYGHRNVIYGNKVRDQLTGQITKYSVIGDCKDKSILIVDDICDGGRTFEVLADLLIKNGAKEVNLYVTHGIFSKGLDGMWKEGIQRFFTAKGEAFEMDGNIVYKEIL